MRHLGRSLGSNLSLWGSCLVLGCSGGDFEGIDSEPSGVENPVDSPSAPESSGSTTEPDPTQSQTPEQPSSTPGAAPTPAAVGTAGDEPGADPAEGDDSDGEDDVDPSDPSEGGEMNTEPAEPTEPTEEPDPEPDPEDDPPEPSEPELPEEPELPMTDHCAAVSDWDPEWVQWEAEVLLLVNEVRSTGYSCGSRGEFEITEPLEPDGALTCAARLHSLDMYERGFFSHGNPDGVDPSQRVTTAGYEWSRTGENIAQGYRSPEAVMEGWLDSDGHCANIMSPDYTDIGIGYYPGDTSTRFSSNAHYWTQNFGTPMRRSGPGGGFSGR